MKWFLSIVMLLASATFAEAANIPLFTGTTGSNPIQGVPATQPDFNTLINNINSSSPYSPALANSNILQNGDFAVDQRNEGTAVTITSGSGSLMTVDRWQGNFAASTSGAGNPTMQQVTSTTGLVNSPKEMKIVASSSAGSTSPAALVFIAQQQIEGSDISDLGWGTGTAEPVTYSFLIKASVAGTYNVFLTNAALARSYVQECVVSTAATTTVCKGTFPGDITGTWNRARGQIGGIFGIALSCGSTFQTTAGSWTAGNFYCDSNQTQLTNNSSATVEVTQLKLERGTFATVFIAPPASDLMKLYRFYTKTFAAGTAPAAAAGYVGSVCQTAQASQPVSWSYRPAIELYSSPTVTTYNPTTSSNSGWYDVTGSTNSAVTVDSGSKGTTGVNIFSATSTAGHILCVHASFDTAL